MPKKNGTSKFAVKQLQGEIKRLFEDLIDLTDLEGTRIDKESAFLSRGLAAYTLYSLSKVSASTAAEAIVDGTGDNGIDAIFWHRGDNVLWLVQSKWIQRGTGNPELGDINKFSTGIKNLIEDNLDRPGLRLEEKKPEVESALSTLGVKAKLVISHTGVGISNASRKCLQDLTKDLNSNEVDASTFTYQIFDKEIAYKTAVEDANKSKIDVDFNLSNWGKIDDPYVAFYGSTSAMDLAKLWSQHGNKLFSDNLRDFIGRTEANDSISQTIKDDPTSFWYFNNGVTVLCKELHRTTRGTKRLSDDFRCKEISIINGAQTVGSIGRYYKDNPDESEENLEQVEVLIRLISLEKCPEGFGVKVTKATNTQNKVEDRDFLALDPIQQKLARELKTWDRSKTYYYKRSNEMVSNENSCTLTEVTQALGCLNNDVKLTAALKKDISEIWSDTSRPLYKKIFNPTVTPLQLWRSVEVHRIVRKLSQEKLKENKPKSKAYKIISKISEHADLFFLYLVFRDLEKSQFNIFQDDFSSKDYDLFLPLAIERRLEMLHDRLRKMPSRTRFGVFFKTPAKCVSLKQEMLDT